MERKEFLPTIAFKKTPELFKTEVQGIPMAITYAEFLPEGKKSSEVSQDELIIYFPGFGSSPETKSYSGVAQEFSNVFGLKVWEFFDATQWTTDRPLLRKAQAVKKLIEEKGIKKIKVVGFSRGGVEAVNFASLFNKDKDQSGIEAECLILLEPVGLTERTKEELFKSYMGQVYLPHQDRVIHKDTREFRRQRKAQHAQFINDLRDYHNEIIKTKWKHPFVFYQKNLKNQFQEMIEFNLNTKRVDIPVLLFQGDVDPVSPKIEAAEVFTRSPWVKQILVKKEGSHGFSYARRKQIAKASFYLPQRDQRELNRELV